MKTAVVLLLAAGCINVAAEDKKCVWKSKTGVNFDLTSLTVPDKKDSYFIIDGDHPCDTDKSEYNFDFVWNICAHVTPTSVPKVCKDKKGAAALQYINRADDYHECEIIGNYDKKHDDASYALLDSADPTLGVELKYKDGSKCSDRGNFKRTATVEVHCANEKSPIVVHALEPIECQYRLVMKSIHGCPTECKRTEKGLCNSHGLCSWDTISKKAYCLCNKGWSGDACDSKNSDSDSYDGYSVQMGLMVTLMLITLALIGVIGVMIYRIKSFPRGGQGSGTGTYNPLGMLPSHEELDAGSDNSDSDMQMTATELRNFDRFSQQENF